MAFRHVVRLRRVFSPAPFGLGRRGYFEHVDAGVSPITGPELINAWDTVYPRDKWSPKTRIGLAVSGGVDSMALAALLSNAAREHDEFPEPYAFIVDHKARKESSEEAEWVAEQLAQKLGMKSQILSLQWDEDPNLIKNFERVARTKRYQALGLACRDLRITSLVTGHHSDDQVETIILRLIMRRLRSGLCGIESVCDIPECDGLHGVWKSSLEVDDRYKASFPIESGGVKLLRPLLRFEKDRLIATCKELSIPWREDATNLDKTFTVRNAVRHIINNHTLPEALSKSSLLALSARMQQRVEEHDKAAERLFNSCKLKLDIQTGSLIVRLPPVEAFLNRTPRTESEKNLARNTATILFSRIHQLVSPKEQKFSISNLASATNFIYPLLSGVDPNSRNLMSFTTQWVWIRRWEGPSLFDGEDSPGAEYLLSRSPFKDVDDEPVRIEVPPNDPESEFHCFDGRWWIRVANKSDCTLVLRPLNEADATRITVLAAKSTDTKTFRNIRRILKLIRPADIRYTIPALFYVKENDNGSTEEEFLGFPSLNESPLNKVLGDKVSWEIRYKKVDLGEHAGPDGKNDSVFSDILTTSAHFHGERSAKKFYNPEFVKNSSVGKQLRITRHRAPLVRRVFFADPAPLSETVASKPSDMPPSSLERLEAAAETAASKPALKTPTSIEQLEAMTSTRDNSHSHARSNFQPTPPPLSAPLLEAIEDPNALLELEVQAQARQGGGRRVGKLQRAPGDRSMSLDIFEQESEQRARERELRHKMSWKVQKLKRQEEVRRVKEEMVRREMEREKKDWERPEYRPLGGRL